MKNTTQCRHSAPEGFEVDRWDSTLYWGHEVRNDHYLLVIAWDVNAGPRAVVEVGDDLPAHALLDLSGDLEAMARRIKRLRKLYKYQ